MSGNDEGKPSAPAKTEDKSPATSLKELAVKDEDTRSPEAKVGPGEAAEAGRVKDQKKGCVRTGEAEGKGADKGVFSVSSHKGSKREGGAGQQKGGGGGGQGMGFLSKFFSQGPRRDRKYYESLSLDEKRQHYKCKGRFVTLDDIETWKDIRSSVRKDDTQMSQSTHSPAPLLDSKVSLWRGDITHLEIDAIVNAANSSLLGGGGVDGAIHNAAGSSLYDECLTLNGCHTGETKITSGHRLPAKYILHTVGPTNRSKKLLTGCYDSCFKLALENNIKSLAFCCIATGIYGYPNEKAADLALCITREWLESNADQIDRVIFCIFLEKDLKIYRQKLHHYFPGEGSRRKEAGSTPPTEQGEKEGETQGNENTETAEDRSKEDIITPSMVRSVTEPIQRLTGTSVTAVDEHESMETGDAEDVKQQDTTGTHDDTTGTHDDTTGTHDDTGDTGDTDTGDTKCDTGDTGDTKCDTRDTKCDTGDAKCDTKCDTSDTKCDTGDMVDNTGDTRCDTVDDSKDIDNSKDMTDEREAKRMKAEAENKMETENGTSATEI